ncbi:MAG TPA: 50S ribosomal protein L18 [Prolixibacteraceae bacterium]|nr:50S ribosomal protein L18 [Prolixibacteraceae bacterium]
MALTKQERRDRIRKRIRKIVSGTDQTPRLSIFRSNKQIYAQLIDDRTGNTLAHASSLDKEIAAAEGNKTEKAAQVGKLIAEKAKAINIETVVFDRGGYLYHGRVKSVADAAREGGLKF